MPQKTLVRKAFALSNFVLAEQICVWVPAAKAVHWYMEMVELELIYPASASYTFSLFFETTNFARTLYSVCLGSRQFH